jgi:uncharacterized protein YciI
MPLYAVIGFDHLPHSMALRDQLRAEHRAYVQQQDQGTRLAGAMYGTLKIFEANSAEEVWAWYREEPFFRNNVYKELHVVEWRLALNTLERTNGWVKNYPTKIGS